MDIAAAIDEIKSILDHSDIGFDKNMVWYIWGKENITKLSWAEWFIIHSDWIFIQSYIEFIELIKMTIAQKKKSISSG